jgi:K+-transporting ATPase ATPase B chain
MMTAKPVRPASGQIISEAIWSSFKKLDPRTQLRNPVMFAVYLGSILTTVLWMASLRAPVVDGVPSTESSGFILGVTVWLWFTVLFANFAEAIAEGHGKAQAATLRKSATSSS